MFHVVLSKKHATQRVQRAELTRHWFVVEEESRPGTGGFPFALIVVAWWVSADYKRMPVTRNEPPFNFFAAGVSLPGPALIGFAGEP